MLYHISILSTKEKLRRDKEKLRRVNDKKSGRAKYALQKNNLSHIICKKCRELKKLDNLMTLNKHRKEKEFLVKECSMTDSVT